MERTLATERGGKLIREIVRLIILLDRLISCSVLVINIHVALEKKKSMFGWMDGWMDGWMEAHSANIMCRCFFLNGLLQLLASCNTITQWIVLRTGQDCFVLFVCVLPP
jgi:hypothetical protein